MLSLGLDIGGANTKAILLSDGKTQDHWLKYIPLWKDEAGLKRFLENLAASTNPEVVGVTMTAELCDVFSSKREGVAKIVETVCEVFGGDVCFFMSLDGILLSRDLALASPEKLAAANWVAGALAVGKEYPNCVMVDVGSTTTDIIPLKSGRPAPFGWTDFQRLRTGELVYTGMLRTPLPFVCSTLRLGISDIRVASENFAIMADVYRVLGELDEEDYTCETPDGRGKDVKSCMRRIARAFCSDLEEVGESLTLEAAEIFRSEQIGLVAKALKEVVSSHGLREAEIVGCGLGRKTVAEKAVNVAGFFKFIDFAETHGEEVALMTPAFGAGILATEAVRFESRG